MLKNILCATSLLCAATFSQAATMSYINTVNLQDTNYDTSLSFQKFDTQGGLLQLESVSFSIDGTITGTARIESLDNQPTVINTLLSAELSLTDALNNQLVVTIPSVTRTFNATAFDGTSDFGGTSGVFYDDLSASQFESAIYTAPATLAMFTGTGTSSFSFAAAATSLATGPGNVISGLTTKASATVEVIYTFSDTAVAVSAPSHMALVGLGLVGFAGLRKFRK